MIKELLFDNIKINSQEKKLKIDNNFLLFLLKNEKEPLKFLKSLNISKEDLENITKNLPKNQQKDFLNLLSKLDLDILDKKAKNNTDIITIEKLLNPNLDIPLPKQNEIKIVNEIKKEIKTLIKTKKLSIPQNELKNFKQISTLKELIEFSNKNGLNIQKIIYSKKEEIQNIINKSHNNTITLNTINTPLKQKIIVKPTKLKNQTILHHKSLLNTILNKKNTKETFDNFDLIKKTNENSDKKQDLDNTEKNNFQNTINITSNQNIKTTIISAKQSLKHFANNLKEAIENYKPPIHKLNIELNPKNLGKVEVTLIHRGDNLQIQINSQQPTINFFNQHQNELKNILVNMGYSEVNMSFNSNQQHQQKKEYSNNQKFFKDEEKEESFIIEIPYQYA